MSRTRVTPFLFCYVSCISANNLSSVYALLVHYWSFFALRHFSFQPSLSRLPLFSYYGRCVEVEPGLQSLVEYDPTILLLLVLALRLTMVLMLVLVPYCICQKKVEIEE